MKLLRQALQGSWWLNWPPSCCPLSNTSTINSFPYACCLLALQRQQQQLQQQHDPEDACDSTAAIGAALSPSQLLPARAAASYAAAQQQPAAKAAEAAAGICCSGARPAAVNTKEGDKEWAALTTWLRMNLHNVRPGGGAGEWGYTGGRG